MPLTIFVARMRTAATHHNQWATSRGRYVAEDRRHREVGRKLLAKAEDWARDHRCEMASDAIIDNELPQRAHEALGYEVVDRCVHYRKGL